MLKEIIYRVLLPCFGVHTSRESKIMFWQIYQILYQLMKFQALNVYECNKDT